MKTWKDEAKLIAQCKRELPYNHTSFEVLVGRYKDLVYTLCYRLVGKKVDAEDLTQEVFTKIFLNLKNFEERSKFSSWVYRIAHNHCLNHISRKKREFEIISEYTEERRREQEIRSADVSEKLQAALNRISPDQRGILIMKYVLGLDLKEIGETLELSLGATKMRLKRARDDFRGIYKADEKEK